MEIKVRGKFKKRKVGFNFDMYAWFLLGELKNKQIHELQQLDQDEFFNGIVYTAAVSWHKDKGRHIWFTPDDVAGWLDDLPQKQIRQLANEFLASKVFGKTLSEWSDEDDKKKQ